jgi:hypothetical protein
MIFAPTKWKKEFIDQPPLSLLAFVLPVLVWLSIQI